MCISLNPATTENSSAVRRKVRFFSRARKNAESGNHGSSKIHREEFPCRAHRIVASRCDTIGPIINKIAFVSWQGCQRYQEIMIRSPHISDQNRSACVSSIGSLRSPWSDLSLTSLILSLTMNSLVLGLYIRKLINISIHILQNIY